MTDLPKIDALGDSALLVTIGDSTGRETAARVHALAGAIDEASLEGVIDVVPAYTSLAVHFDMTADVPRLTARLHAVVTRAVGLEVQHHPGKTVEIPVRYDGPDLSYVADVTGLAVDDVIARHSAREYFVYMLGFAPGFAYLGDLDAVLHLPRRESPRARVPRGAVAIAGSQTAVYPHETPGGWHLIGTTELRMFDVERDPPSLLRAGDRVRFVSIA